MPLPPAPAQALTSTPAGWQPPAPVLEWPTEENIHSMRDPSLPSMPHNPHARSPNKPPYSYASMIGQAIWNAPGQRARLEQIYEYIRIIYPWYRTCDSQWQNMLRHKCVDAANGPTDARSLSLRPVFVKQARIGTVGKGNDWTMDMSLEPLGFSGLEFGTRRGIGSKRGKGSKAKGTTKRKPKAVKAELDEDDYYD